jgi:hypothetical protein
LLLKKIRNFIQEQQFIFRFTGSLDLADNFGAMRYIVNVTYSPTYLSVFVPVVPVWSIEHLWVACFHFSFVVLDSRQDSLGGGLALRKNTTYTGQHKHKISTYRHPCIEWDSNPWSQCSIGRRLFMP